MKHDRQARPTGNSKKVSGNKMKFIQPICVIILFFSCSQTEPINSRFEFDSISLTAFSWKVDTAQRNYKFYITNYFEMDSNGQCLVMRRDTFLYSPKYFHVDLPSTLDSSINALKFEQLDTTYFTSIDNQSIYCGYTYCIRIESQNNRIKYVRYIPKEIDSTFLTVHKIIQAIIKSSSQERDSFDFESKSNYIASLEDTSLFPKIREIIKFNVPK